MARKKKKEDMVGQFVGILTFTAFALTFLSSQSLGMSVFVACLVLAAAFVVLKALHNARNEKLRRSGIAEIDLMEGRQFEVYLAQLFKAHGYQTEVTRFVGDFGADLVIEKEGRRIVVQAKRYTKSVGIKAVQEVQASKAHYGASEAWVVTNRDYTEAAYELAKSNGVHLINRTRLIEMILHINPEQAAAARQEAAVTEEKTVRLCKRCGAQMVLRKGPRGEFFGCSTFPKCRSTESVS